MGARKWKEEREKAREVLRHSVQSECEKKFGPVVGKNQVCKWVKAAKKERWDLLPQAVRVRSVTTPNQWRSKHALAPRGRRVGGHVPMELQRELDRLILATVRGNSDVTERTDVVTTDHIATTISGLIADWNSGLEVTRSLVTAHNQDLLKKHDEGQLTAAAVTAGWLPDPTKVEIPSPSWCSKFKNAWGWSLLAAGSSGQQSLPFGHSDMQAARDYVNNLIKPEPEGEGIHPGLILNFDQVWRAAFQWTGKLWYKDRNQVAERGMAKKAPGTLNKKHVYVKGSRRSLTAMTSTWSDGSRGPICFSCPEGSIDATTIRKFNDEHVGTAMILMQGRSLEFHPRYGLSDEGAKACFLCDAWSGFFQNPIPSLPCRDLFYKTHNIQPPRRMPGGWSAHGQPCDQFHATLRDRIRQADLRSVGMGGDLRQRAQYHEVDLRACGQLVRTADNWEGVVNLTLGAWESMPRRVFSSAWLVCGYFDQSHFQNFLGAEVLTIEEAKSLLCDSFAEYGLASTPQRCTRYEWQIQD
ncbi:unnamed protein product [Durusdinium trenchii]|uniref:Uncharacterized protein n=1 Tax=Durusdinium trenchii TaxID=1381693 RepID=A0ABP0K6J8_9DINO